MKTIKAEWPKVFTDSDFEYETLDPSHIAAAMADGFTGWGHCSSHLAGPIPANFGKGMVKISKTVGVTATADNLTTRARELNLLGP